MSSKVNFILFILFISILGINFEIDSTKQKWQVDYKKSSDSLTILKSLIGEWIWDSTYCSQKRTANFAGFYYKIVFSKNFNLKVYENNDLIKATRWTINKKNENISIKTFPPVKYVSGEIYFNRNSLKFRDRNSLGYDYYFSRYFSSAQISKNRQ